MVNRVYLVRSGQWDCLRVESVHSTEDRAQKRAEMLRAQYKRRGKLGLDTAEVLCFEIDGDEWEIDLETW